MILEENWSISPQRIEQFLLTQPDVTKTATGFQYRTCQIILNPVQGTLMGKWQQQRTLIRMEGEDTDTKQIQRRIFLQFLSAGG